MSTWKVTQDADEQFILCIYRPNRRTFRKVLTAVTWSSAIREARIVVTERGIE